MIRNYLITVLRNFQKNKILSLINLVGLSVGITAVLLIGMYIFNETGYDNFQKNSRSVFRVGFHFFQNGRLQGEGSEFTPPFGPDAMGEFPEIKTFTRISSQRMAYLGWGDKTLKVENIHHADSNFFQVFSYKLLQGNPNTVLKEPYSIILTREIATKLFGKSEDAIGKVVRLDSRTNYTVTGIAQEPPANSHLGYDALISFITLYKEPGNYLDWNGGEQYITYLQLKDGVNRASFEKKLPGFMWKHINEEYSKVGFKLDAFLEPVRDIHLYYGDDNGNLRTNLYIFSIVALLILVISCVNYVNLTMAQATARFREIGVRKVIGATRRILIRQFLFETVLTTLIAFLVAIALALLLSPVYRQLLGKNLPILSFSTLPALLYLFVIIVAVGIITGSYVAFHLSSFTVTRIFRSSLPGSRQHLFRKGMIVMQFAISIGLMSYTLLVTLQLRFSKNINPGYDREHILVLPLVGENSGKAYPMLRQKLMQLPEVEQVSGLSEVPFDGITSNGFTPEGSTKAMVLHQLDADENFPETFNIKIRSGTYFSKDHPANQDGYLINETLERILGWQNPLGKSIYRNGKHTIIGVVKDFHFASLHSKIEPLIITNQPWEGRFEYLTVKYHGTNTAGLISHIRQTWKSTLPESSFDYWFLDDAFNNIYQDEERFQQIFFYFSALSILLTLAGVFGLVLLALKQRTKELGIRKVLGAELTDIIKLMVKDFVWLVLSAALLAAPVSWYYMQAWLQNFAYRIPISWWMFTVCSLLVFIITFATISIQAIRAATANPVDSLRTE